MLLVSQARISTSRMSICVCSHVAFIFQKMIQSKGSPAHPTESALFEPDVFNIHRDSLTINHAPPPNLNYCLALFLISSKTEHLRQWWFIQQLVIEITSNPCTTLTLNYNIALTQSTIGQTSVICQHFLGHLRGSHLGDYGLEKGRDVSHHWNGLIVTDQDKCKEGNNPVP